MRDKIMRMLNEIRPEFDFVNSKDFVADGLLDSFDIITLISMIEEEYHVKIDGLDILPENFSSVETIVAMIMNSGDR